MASRCTVYGVCMYVGYASRVGYGYQRTEDGRQQAELQITESRIARTRETIYFEV